MSSFLGLSENVGKQVKRTAHKQHIAVFHKAPCLFVSVFRVFYGNNVPTKALTLTKEHILILGARI